MNNNNSLNLKLILIKEPVPAGSFRFKLINKFTCGGLKWMLL
jgi:hypothetical protein